MNIVEAIRVHFADEVSNGTAEYMKKKSSAMCVEFLKLLSHFR